MALASAPPSAPPLASARRPCILKRFSSVSTSVQRLWACLRGKGAAHKASVEAHHAVRFHNLDGRRVRRRLSHGGSKKAGQRLCRRHEVSGKNARQRLVRTARVHSIGVA